MLKNLLLLPAALITFTGCVGPKLLSQPTVQVKPACTLTQEYAEDFKSNILPIAVKELKLNKEYINITHEVKFCHPLGVDSKYYSVINYQIQDEEQIIVDMSTAVCTSNVNNKWKIMSAQIIFIEPHIENMNINDESNDNGEHTLRINNK